MRRWQRSIQRWPTTFYSSGDSGYQNVTYYVDPAGSDANDGLSTGAAWATAAKVTASKFVPGDTIAFKRGATFYTDSIQIRDFRSVGRGAHEAKVTVKDYGDPALALPTLSAWKILTPGHWTEDSPGIWKFNVNVDITGNTYTTGAFGANIGRLLVDGVIKTMKQQSLVALANDWDFYSDGANYLYVKSVADPGTRATTIMVSPRVNGFSGNQGLKTRNLHIYGCGGDGLFAYSDNDHQWNWIDTCGGSYLSNLQRYGNGIENNGGGSRIIASNNLFTNIYDVALSTQGSGVQAAGDGWNDIEFSDNWIARCAQATEFWSRYSAVTPNAGVSVAPSGQVNVRARRLHLWDIGQAESRLGRDPQYDVGPFLEFRMETPYNAIPVSVAEMHNCADYLMNFPSVSPDRQPRTTPDYVIEPSALSMPAGSLLMQGYSHTVEQWASFVAATGIGIGSTMNIEISPSLTAIATIYDAWQASGVH